MASANKTPGEKPPPGPCLVSTVGRILSPGSCRDFSFSLSPRVAGAPGPILASLLVI